MEGMALRSSIQVAIEDSNYCDEKMKIVHYGMQFVFNRLIGPG